jgi:hypothetical protein
MLLGRLYLNIEFIVSGFRRADGTFMSTKYYLPHIGSLFALVGIYSLFKNILKPVYKSIILVLGMGLSLGLFEVLTLRNSLLLQTMLPLTIAVGFKSFFELITPSNFSKKLETGILLLFALQVLFVFLEIGLGQT